MTNFRGQINGLLGGSFPWSTRLCMSGALVEGTLATAFNTAVTNLFTTATNGLENFMSADVTVVNTTMSTLNSTMHQTTKTTTANAITGTDANPSMPWNIAEVITLRSIDFTKSGHGRLFLPPFAEDQVTAHVIKAATTAKMKIVFDAFFAAIIAAGAQPFIFNERTKKDGTPPYTITNIINYDISDKPAQQRRRVSKVGPTRVIGTGF